MMADDPILAAIERLSRDVAALRIDFTQRVDQMVTRNEHTAEVRRLDAELTNCRDTNRRERETNESRWSEIEAKIEEGDETIMRSLSEADDRRRRDRQWLMGWMLAAIAAASALGGFIENLLH